MLHKIKNWEYVWIIFVSYQIDSEKDQINYKNKAEVLGLKHSCLKYIMIYLYKCEHFKIMNRLIVMGNKLGSKYFVFNNYKNALDKPPGAYLLQNNFTKGLIRGGGAYSRVGA